FTQTGQARVVTAGDDGLGAAVVLGATASPDADVVSAVDPDGGGVLGWSAMDGAGRPGVGVREDFGAGGAAAGVGRGPHAGAVAELSIGRASSGDAILGFRQGDAGRFAIVVDRVSAPPATFGVSTPTDWVRPRAARISWDPAASGVAGGVRYSVL